MGVNKIGKGERCVVVRDMIHTLVDGNVISGGLLAQCNGSSNIIYLSSNFSFQVFGLDDSHRQRMTWDTKYGDENVHSLVNTCGKRIY